MTERPSPRPHEPTPDRLSLRDRVSPEVLAYLGHLRGEMVEIAKRHGVTDLRGLPAKIESGDVPMEDVDRLAELRKAFEWSVMTNQISQEELQRIERERKLSGEAKRRENKQLMAPFLESLKSVVEVYVSSRTFAHRQQLHKSDMWLPELQDAVDALPPLPAAVLLGSDGVMSEVITSLRGHFGHRSSNEAGFIASLIMNHSIRRLAPELRDRVVQTIDAAQFDNADLMKCVGYEWMGGTLILLGEFGQEIGRAMSGGTILADRVRAYAGMEMTGGKLVVREGTCLYAGFAMTNGTIEIAEAGKGTGSFMSGGLIIAEFGGDEIGKQMTGGHIVIRGRAGNELGRSMIGGKIEAESAQFGVGYAMSSGTIRLKDAAGDVGTSMRGGSITVETCFAAGMEMSNGEIRITGSCTNEVGRSMGGGSIWVQSTSDAGGAMRGGRIVVLGSVGVAGSGMTGGTIDIHGEMDRKGDAFGHGKVRYVGKGAWWKNLWARFK